MEAAKFQEKLRRLCELAKKEGGVSSRDMVERYLEEAQLNQEQMEMVLRYLKLQGISVEEEEKESLLEKEGDGTAGIKKPLTLEEEAYLDAYLSSLGEEPKESGEELFLALSRGDAAAMSKLSQKYLFTAAEMAADMNCQEIPLSDLIQEANLGLLAALKEPKPKIKNDLWIRAEIRKGILWAIQEQTRQSFQDECLVEKVEKLERAVKDLADEDGETSFTVDELAVILDMSVEEIRDILRLAGDHK